jgi:CHAT domain-containing protein
LLARGDRTPRGAFDAAAEPACRAVGATLRQRIWDPLSVRLRGFDRLFIVPDGSLHLLNFAALPTGKSSYLVETGPLIQYLSAERDLVRIPQRHGGSGLLAVGGASFDSMEEPPEIPAHGSGLDSVRSSDRRAGSPLRSMPVRRGPQPDCREFRDTRFLPLPESAREVEEIASLWGDPAGTTALTGAHAGEAALKMLAPGRRVLHLATHGFFLDATHCASEQPGTRGIGGVSGATAAHASAAARRGSPLLLSGLALAGANLRLHARPDQEDGILMAQEIVSLDLSSAEWVVLSACDTGLGKVQAGEGVLGLRRAFEAAGAGTVIMSLWEVEDRSTREWMRGLYQARFHRRLTTPESVREAALGVLQDRKAQGLGTHPFYWAGFVAAGDWR